MKNSDLELKQIYEELQDVPFRSFDIAFALMAIIPLLGFMYVLVGILATFKALEGNIGLILLSAVVISLAGFWVGRMIVRRLLLRVVEYMRRLKENDRQKSIFVAEVSHDIRGPLSTLQLALANLLDGLTGTLNERQQEIVKGGKQVTERLSRFCSNMHDISKIEAGRVELRRSSVELHELLHTALKTLRPVFDARQVSLDQDVSFPHVAIWADEDKVRDAVSHLVEHALESSPENGRISIKLFDEISHARLEFIDAGEQVSTSDAEKVFNKFEQVTSHSSSLGPANLTMPLVKDFVELHRGRIWMESHQNEGNKVVVLLPKDLRTRKRT